MEKEKKTEPLASLEPLDPTIPEAIAWRISSSKSLQLVFKVKSVWEGIWNPVLGIFIHYLP